MSEIVHLGCAGHFIASNSCRWRRHTQVGRYRVSSVGDYWCDNRRQTLGCGPDSFFETFVFRTTGQPDSDSEGCGCQAVTSWSEIDSERYATAGAAQQGHERFVAKYAAIVKAEGR